MKMGTRVSQFVHFIIYQTAPETSGEGCEGLWREQEREVVKEMLRVRDGAKRKEDEGRSKCG